jgi:hypothetical protein
MLRTLLVTLAALTTNSSFVLAQTTDTTTNGNHGTSVLFEAAIGTRLNRLPYPGVQEAKLYGSWELGPLFNRGEWAWSAAVMAAADEDGQRWGVRARYRRWLDPYAALDLGAGILIGGETQHAEQHYPGFTGLVGLTLGDLLGVNLELQAISTSQEYYPPSRVDVTPSDRGKSIDWAWLLSVEASGAGALALTCAELFAAMWFIRPYTGF